MITQRDLKAVVDARKRAAALEKDPQYLEYAAELQRLSDEIAGLAKPAAVLMRERHLAEVGTLLDALKERTKAEEPVEAGKLTLSYKRTPAVSWEGFWKSVALLPVMAAALARCEQARELVRQASTKDTAAPFVSEKLSGFDVVSAG